MKIEINCRGWAAVVRMFEIAIEVCIAIFAIGKTIGAEIDALDPIDMTWLIIVTYLGVLWLVINKLRHDLEKIAEKEDENEEESS